MSDFDLEYHLRELEDAAGSCASGIGGCNGLDVDRHKHAITEEFNALRDAVRVLGAGYRHWTRWVDTEATPGPGPSIHDAVMSNPIAAAAVKGAQ